MPLAVLPTLSPFASQRLDTVLTASLQRPGVSGGAQSQNKRADCHNTDACRPTAISLDEPRGVSVDAEPRSVVCAPQPTTVRPPRRPGPTRSAFQGACARRQVGRAPCVATRGFEWRAGTAQTAFSWQRCSAGTSRGTSRCTRTATARPPLRATTTGSSCSARAASTALRCRRTSCKAARRASLAPLQLCSSFCTSTSRSGRFDAQSRCAIGRCASLLTRAQDAMHPLLAALTARHGHTSLPEDRVAVCLVHVRAFCSNSTPIQSCRLRESSA